MNAPTTEMVEPATHVRAMAIVIGGTGAWLLRTAEATRYEKYTAELTQAGNLLLEAEEVLRGAGHPLDDVLKERARRA